jgi:IclR family mhp operon transcriptional activator
MKNPKVKSIQSLARGLKVLQLLQTSGALSLADLHRLSGVPKASLLRILKTLSEQGAVWQRMADNAYVPSFSLSELAGRMDREHELVEAASPILARLSDVVQWPSVLAVPRLTHMEVIETNVSRATMDNVPLGPVGFQVNMLRSASGRAYFAACEDAIRDATLDRLRRSRRHGDRFARHATYVENLLAEAQSKGFALRDPDFGGDYDRGRDTKDDGRDSLGVAIRLGQHVPGAINITWAQRVFTRDQAIKTFAGPALRAAQEIAAKLSHG